MHAFRLDKIDGVLRGMGNRKRETAKYYPSRVWYGRGFLRRERQPEENISHARTVLSPRFLYHLSLMEKRYLAMWMWLCEGKREVKVAPSLCICRRGYRTWKKNTCQFIAIIGHITHKTNQTHKARNRQREIQTFIKHKCGISMLN